MAKKMVTQTAAMAKIIEAMRKKNQDEKENKYDPEKQVEGYKKRLEASDLDVEKVTDKRGIVKKALNLREDQNPLFDFFEVINRPQQALFGGIKAAQEGGDFFEGAAENFKGNNYTRFKEILHNAGFEDSEKLGIDDALGFAGDVFLDPLQWAFLPAKVGSIGKIAKTTQKIAKAEDKVKALTAAGETVLKSKELVEATAELTKLQKVLDGLNKTTRISPLRYGMRGIKQGGTYTIKHMDIGVTNLLEKLDLHKLEKMVNGFDFKKGLPIANSGKKGLMSMSEFEHIKRGADTLKRGGIQSLSPEDIQKAYDATHKLKMSKTYRGIKTTFQQTFDGLSNIPTVLLNKMKGFEADHRMATEQMKIVLDNYSNETFPTLVKKIKSIKGYENLDDKVIEKMVGDLVERGGLDYTTTFLESFTEEGLLSMQHTGVAKEQVQLYEDFLKTFMPELWDDAVNQKIEIWSKKSIKDTGYEGLEIPTKVGKVDTYRMNPQFSKQIQAKMEQMQKKDPTEIIKKGKVGDLTEDEAKELARLKLERSDTAKKTIEDFDKETISRKNKLDAAEKEQLAKKESLTETRETYIEETKARDVVKRNKKTAENQLKRLEESTLTKNKKIQKKIAALEDEIKVAEQNLKVQKSKVIPKQTGRNKETGANNFDKILSEKRHELETLTKPLKDSKEALIKAKREEVEKLTREYARKSEDVETFKKYVQEREAEVIKANTAYDRAKINSEKLAKSTGAKEKARLEAIEKELKELEDLEMSPDRGYVKSITVKDFMEQSDARFAAPRFYSKQEDSLFSKLMGWEVDKAGKIIKDADGLPIRKVVDELTEDQKLWRELVSETESTMTKMTDYVNQMGGDLNFKKGYMHHMITDERKYADRDVVEAAKTWASSSNLRGKIQTINSRTWRVSRLEANKLVNSQIDHLIDQKLVKDEHVAFWRDMQNKKLFSEELLKPMADFVTTVPEQTKQARMLTEVLVKSMFDKKIFRTSFAGGEVPKGFTSVTRAALERKLEKMERFAGDKEGFKIIKDMLKTQSGDVFHIDSNIFHYIGRLGDEQGASSLMQVATSMNNMFKRNKLLSPGFQLRNFVGNYSRAYLAGMPAPQIVRYGKKAHGILMQGDDLLKKATLGLPLTNKEVKVLAEYQEFIRLGFATTGRNLHDLPENLFKGKIKDKHLLDKLARWNGDLNWATDKRFRLGMYMWAKENPEVLTRFGFDDAAQYVRYALFDYSDLSHIEKTYIRNVIPFYTFTKKNLAYQFRNMFENPEIYKKMTNAFDNLWLNVTEDDSFESIDSYRRQNYWLPIPSLNEKGKYISLKSSLPTGNLGEFAGAPLKNIVQATAPYIRAPFEAVVNRQTFSGMPIQEFKGQKGFAIPEIDRRIEFGLSQTGLDVPIQNFVANPLRAASKIVKGEEPVYKGALDGVLGSAYSYGDTEKTRERVAYNELDKIRNIMKYYKQEGVEIVTLAEAENRQRNKMISNHLQRLREIQKRPLR